MIGSESPRDGRVETLRERKQRLTREALVQALLDVIAERGVQEATISLISVRSGISRGTIYAHFPGGRDELLRAAYARLGEQLVERTRAAVGAAAGWREALAAHADAMFELADDALTGHFFNVSGPTFIVDGAERGIGSGASARMIAATLDAARASGEVGADVDPGSTAVLLVGALREAAIRVSAGELDPERANLAFARLAAGLAAAEAAGPRSSSRP